MPDTDTTFEPYRVRRREFAGPPLTTAQAAVLTCLVDHCPDAGLDVDARTIAAATGQRLGGTVIVLRSLAKRRLVICHDGDAQLHEAFSPSLTGRSRVRHSQRIDAETTAALPAQHEAATLAADDLAA